MPTETEMPALFRLYFCLLIKSFSAPIRRRVSIRYRYNREYKKGGYETGLSKKRSCKPDIIPESVTDPGLLCN